MQCLIWARNKSNFLFGEEASAIKQTTPDVVPSSFLNKSKDLFLSACDLSQYYNNIWASYSLVPLLGLPRSEARLLGTSYASRHVTSCLTCIQMGAKLQWPLNRELLMPFLTLSVPLFPSRLYLNLVPAKEPLLPCPTLMTLA